MKFEEPEGREGPEEIPEKTREIKAFLESTAGELRENEGVPVDALGRIDMEAFQNIYPDLRKDKELVEMWEEEWYPGLTHEAREEERMRSDGEKLEMLKSAVFHKNLGSQFIVTRASRYDDIKNKIDNILLERKTGNLVCAFDEVGDTSGSIYEEKKNKIFERNTKEHGASLKYGISFEEVSGRQELRLGAVDHVPIFYIALPKTHIERGVNQFIPRQAPSDFERKLFEYIVATLYAQIQGLELLDFRMDDKVKARVATFHSFLDRLKKTR